MALNQIRTNETAILVRVFNDTIGRVHPDMIRIFLDLSLNDQDKARLHELIVRNQADELAPDEKKHLHALLNASSVIDLLRAKARRRLTSGPPGDEGRKGSSGRESVLGNPP